MSELLAWIEAHPVTTVIAIAVALLAARGLWQWLTRQYTPISAADAGDRLHDGRTWFLDVRTPAELRHGQIPGALHIPVTQLKGRLDELGERVGEAPVVVYCHSGLRSARAAHVLTRSGFSEVYNLRGGVMAWQSQDLPMTEHHG